MIGFAGAADSRDGVTLRSGKVEVDGAALGFSLGIPSGGRLISGVPGGGVPVKGMEEGGLVEARTAEGSFRLVGAAGRPAEPGGP